ncbi:hypothetical protein [Sagittula sp. S175]|uniref:hypothetical protein n=1 Tax=Sagittula sp. S175 TaxID=3415129 RepID=UPI003C7CCBE1
MRERLDEVRLMLRSRRENQAKLTELRERGDRAGVEMGGRVLRMQEDMILSTLSRMESDGVLAMLVMSLPREVVHG